MVVVDEIVVAKKFTYLSLYILYNPRPLIDMVIEN